MQVIRVRRYRGAYILIVEFQQKWLGIVYYRGQFYHVLLDAFVKGDEYNAGEFTEAADVALRQVHELVDSIKKGRSIKQIIINLWRKLRISLLLRTSRRTRNQAEPNLPMSNPRA